MSEYKLIVVQLNPVRSFFGRGGSIGTKDFEDAVSKHLAEGWTCQGSPNIFFQSEKVIALMQAVTR
jgi:hypothetical protein